MRVSATQEQHTEKAILKRATCPADMRCECEVQLEPGVTHVLFIIRPQVVKSSRCVRRCKVFFSLDAYKLWKWCAHALCPGRSRSERNIIFLEWEPLSVNKWNVEQNVFGITSSKMVKILLAKTEVIVFGVYMQKQRTIQSTVRRFVDVQQASHCKSVVRNPSFKWQSAPFEP